MSNIPHFVETNDEYETRTGEGKEARADDLMCGGERIWVSNDSWYYDANKKDNSVLTFIEKVNSSDWDIHIELK